MSPDATLLQDVAEIRVQLATLLAAVARLTDRGTEAAWEPIGHALRTRHRGRKVIMDAIKDGRISHRRVPTHGPVPGYLLLIEDLDRHFPRIARAKKSPGGSTPPGSALKSGPDADGVPATALYSNATLNATPSQEAST